MTAGRDHRIDEMTGIQEAGSRVETAATDPTRYGPQRQIPQHIWTLLLLLIVIALASQAFTDRQPASPSRAAGSLPFVLMMTEGPTRHAHYQDSHLRQRF